MVAQLKMDLVQALLDAGRFGCFISVSEDGRDICFDVPEGTAFSQQSFDILKQYKSLLLALSCSSGGKHIENICIGDYERTSGSYENEADAEDHFDQLASRSGLWKIHKQVVGHSWQPRPGADPKKHLRIDRILQPTQKLIDAGWAHGCAGVEVKASGLKIGKPVSQMLDYSRCVWSMPTGNTTTLKYTFLFPCVSALGNVMSIMTQNNLGFCYEHRGHLRLSIGSTVAFGFDSLGQLVVRSLLRGGKKAGSR